MDRKLTQRRKFPAYTGLGFLGTGLAVIANQFYSQNTTSLDANSEADASTVDLSSGNQKLPEFQGISQWLNSSPLTTKDLNGSVVLIQFWTFSCINCQRTLPYVTQWHQKYAARGLKVIGIHTPEFAYSLPRIRSQYKLRKKRLTGQND